MAGGSAVQMGVGMISSTVLQTLENYVPRENILLQEPMSRHTTFRIGGEADCFVEIENAEQLIHLRRYLQMVELPCMVLGNGSNLLVSDRGVQRCGTACGAPDAADPGAGRPHGGPGGSADVPGGGGGL